MKRSIDQINWMPEIVQQIQSFTEFAEGVPVTACDELLKVLEEGNDQYYVVKNEDWNIFIRKIGPQKASKMFCSIKNLGITSGSAEKEFARDANGFCDMVAWCKAINNEILERCLRSWERVLLGRPAVRLGSPWLARPQRYLACR